MVDVTNEAGLRIEALERENAKLRAALASAPQASQPPQGAEPEFTDTARAALLWVLWHHQGGSSKVGQAMRFALGMGAHDRLSERQVAEAKRWAALAASPPPATQEPAAESVARWLADHDLIEEAEKVRALYAAPAPVSPDGLQQLRALIADDSYAITFQTMGQYRSELLKRSHSMSTVSKGGSHE